MALAITHLTTANDDTNATSYTTASLSPTGSSLLVVGVVGAVSGAPPTPTISGFSATWTAIQSSAFDVAGTQRTLFTFYAQLGASPGTGTIGISFGATSMSGCGWSVVQVTGHNTSTPIRLPVESHSTGTSQSTTLAALADSANVALAFVASDEAVTFTAGNAFTMLGQATGAAPVQAIGSLWKLNATNPATTSTGTAGQSWGMVAVEIQAAAVVAAPTGMRLKYRVAFAFGIPPTQMPASGDWVYMDGRPRAIEITRGRTRETEHVQPGRARLKLRVRDRALEPEYAASPYYPDVVPQTPVKIEAVFQPAVGSPVTYTRFVGTADDFQPTWNPDGDVIVPCSDLMTDLQAAQLRTPYVDAVLSTAPAVYWRLSETDATQAAADESGNGRYGQYQGAPTFGQTDPITDANDGAVLFPADSWVGGPAGQGSMAMFSMAIWFRHATVTSADLSYITAWTTTTGSGQQVYMGGTSSAFPGKIAVLTVGGGFTTAARYDDDAWHFLVLVGDGTNGRLYIDAVDVSGAFSTPGPYSGDQITVGGWPLLGGSYSFGGAVDEAAFWSARVLTAGEVSAMYAARTAWLNDLSGARVTKTLAMAGWTGTTAIEAGHSTLQSASDIAGSTALAYLQTIEDSEAGTFFVDVNGAATFYDRHHFVLSTTSAATFGDTSGELRYSSMEPESPITLLRNEWTVQRSGGPTQTVRDTTSIARYGRRTWPQSGAVQLEVTTDSVALDLARWWLTHWKDPLFAIRRMVCQQASEALIQACLGLELMTRVTVRRRPHGGTLVEGDQIVQGYTETWGEGSPAKWQIVYNLSPADTQQYWVWGTSTWGTSTVWGV